MMKSTVVSAMLFVSSLHFLGCNHDDARAVEGKGDESVDVYIDIGHGGADAGALFPDGRTTEKDVLLNIGTAIAGRLSSEGVNAIVNRPDDRFLTLQERSNGANESKPACVVSLHLNVSRDSSNRGFCVIHQAGQPASITLAQNIQKELRALSYLKDNGITSGRLHILKTASAPAVVIDIAYVSNADDGSTLLDRSRQAEIVRSLAKSIRQFIRS